MPSVSQTCAGTFEPDASWSSRRTRQGSPDCSSESWHRGTPKARSEWLASLDGIGAVRRLKSTSSRPKATSHTFSEASSPVRGGHRAGVLVLGCARRGTSQGSH